MNKLTDLIKRFGIKGCLYKTVFKIGRLLGFTYIKYLAYYKDLPETIDANSLLQYHKMTMEDFKKQAEFDGMWFTNRKLNQIERFINEPGYSYYGIYDGDRIMCYAALSTEYDNFINSKADIRAAYLFDDYTNPLYRGKGLHKKIVAIREYEAWKQGKSITYAYVHSLNRASANGFKRCGYVAKIKLTYKRVGKNKPYKRTIKDITVR